MRFYLGTHQPAWLAADPGVPLLVSHRRLVGRRLPCATGPWACDSDGFTELSRYGRWRTTEHADVTALRRYATEIGHLAWCAPIDHMTEAQVLSRTDGTVHGHERRTVANYLRLREMALELPIIPVLQGQSISDYLLQTSESDAGGAVTNSSPVHWPDRRHVRLTIDQLICGYLTVVKVCTAKIDSIEYCFLQVGASEIHIPHGASRKVCTDELGASKRCLVQVCIAKFCPVQRCAIKVCPAKVDPHEVTIVPICPPCPTGSQVRLAQVGTDEPRSRKICLAEIKPRQGEPDNQSVFRNPTQDSYSSMHISRSVLQPRKIAIDRRSRVRVRVTFISSIPRHTASKKRCDNFGYSRLVGWGVTGDSFQRVESTDSYVELFGTQLVDCVRESVGHVAFTGDLDLPPSHRSTRNHEQSAYRLQERGAHTILKLRLLLLQLDARIRSSNTRQVTWCQVGVKQPRNKCQDNQQSCHKESGSYADQFQVASRHAAQSFYDIPLYWNPPSVCSSVFRLRDRSGGTKLGQRRMWAILPHLCQLLVGGVKADFEVVDFAEPTVVLRFPERSLRLTMMASNCGS